MRQDGEGRGIDRTLAGSFRLLRMLLTLPWSLLELEMELQLQLEKEQVRHSEPAAEAAEAAEEHTAAEPQAAARTRAVPTWLTTPVRCWEFQ